jgi:hypothetical protein
MSILIRDTQGVYRHRVEKALSKNATGQQVLDHLFGLYGEDPGVNFVIREWREVDTTKLQRLNMIWAILLTIVLWPFRYILNGDGGWSTKTRMGRFILRVTGHLKDAEASHDNQQILSRGNCNEYVP